MGGAHIETLVHIENNHRRNNVGTERQNKEKDRNTRSLEKGEAYKIIKEKTRAWQRQFL